VGVVSSAETQSNFRYNYIPFPCGFSQSITYVNYVANNIYIHADAKALLASNNVMGEGF